MRYPASSSPSGLNGHSLQLLTIYLQALLEKNAKVYMACRNQLKAAEAILELQKQRGREATFLQLDLSDLHSVKAAAEDFLTYVTSS